MVLVTSVAFLVFSITAMAETLKVLVPRTSEEPDRNMYQLQLLNFILKKAGIKDYIIEETKQLYTQARIEKELKSGKIDLYWMGTSEKFERELIPIYYPIYRGLLGYRVFIIHKASQKRFDKVRTLKDLQKFIGAQGIGWSDNAILEHAGLKQVQAKYENIFLLIEKRRVDYFSRGITEAHREVLARRNKYKNITVENKILLVYPFAMFFFVSPKNKELAQILNRGFDNAYRDGSFNRWFYSIPYIKNALRVIKGRRTIYIDNPLLSERVKNLPAYRWHNPE